MPTGVALVGKKPYVIRFNGGRLDPAVHLGAERIAMQYSGRRTTLEIAQNGMLSVSYLDVEPGATDLPDEKKGAELPKKE
jgi:hypothetical protein